MNSFDLDRAIAAWRRQYRHRRVFFREDLDELECHLRDHLAHLRAEDCSEEDAFRRAVQAVGASWEAEDEYRKVYWGKLRRRHELFRELLWRLAMLTNYFKIAFRTLRKQAGYTVINVAGLAIGLACCLLIYLYVQDELSFDRFHEKADRIYRVEREISQNQGRGRSSFTDGPTAPGLEAEYPEIEAAVRLSRLEHLVRYEDRQFYGNKVVYADSHFFDVFSFPLRQGNPASALAAPNRIVITASMAETYFGDEDPMGKTLRIDNEDDFVVAGVMDDVPHTSHYVFDAVASYSTLPPKMPWLEQRGSISLQTYVLLAPGTSAQAVEAKLPEYVERYYADSPFDPAIRLRPLTRIHLYSEVYELEPQGDIETIYTFSAIALFILLLACINYMNLSTARSVRRMKEVGMRKVVGARHTQLVVQFLGESILLALAALLIALSLVVAVLPVLNGFLGRALTLGAITNRMGLAVLVGMCLSVGVLAGLYPALYMTRFQPVQVLKGTLHGIQSGAFFRKALVVAQFVVSIALLAATAIVYQQLQFIQQKHLGFDKEHVVNVHLRDPKLLEKAEVLQQQFQNDPQVTSASISSSGVGEFVRSSLIDPVDEQADLSSTLTGFLFTDPEFIPTMGIEMAAGRNFSRERAAEAEAELILNEAAVRQFGWASPEEALGEKLSGGWMNGEGTIIGVAKDFHVRSLRTGVPPVLLMNTYLPDDALLSLRLRPGNVAEALPRFEAIWRDVIPDWPFEYAFLDQQLDQRYQSDRQTGELFGVFAGLAILIACLGLFGLAAYSAERRTKEIGVRKTFGATVTHIVVLLSKDFTRLVLVAFVLAAPLAYLAMQRWLEDFAYRIDISWPTFFLAGLTALVIAWLTVSYQAIRAALADPVKSLRYE